METDFQRRKVSTETVSSSADKETLPELSDPIYRAMLIKAYRRIEEQLQKREALQSNQQ